MHQLTHEETEGIREELVAIRASRQTILDVLPLTLGKVKIELSEELQTLLDRSLQNLRFSEAAIAEAQRKHLEAHGAFIGFCQGALAALGYDPEECEWEQVGQGVELRRKTTSSQEAEDGTR